VALSSLRPFSSDVVAVSLRLPATGDLVLRPSSSLLKERAASVVAPLIPLDIEALLLVYVPRPTASDRASEHDEAPLPRRRERERSPRILQVVAAGCARHWSPERRERTTTHGGGGRGAAGGERTLRSIVRACG